MVNEVLSYLKNVLGLDLVVMDWGESADWPVFLAKAADYAAYSADGVGFVVASMPGSPSLPELKRVYLQATRKTNLPVAVVNVNLDARQRKALLQQGIPFVVPGKQVYLPFLGLVAKAAAEGRSLGEHFSPSTQAALVTIVANPKIRTGVELRETMNATSSSISRSLDELSERGLIEKSKTGREIVFDYDDAPNALLKSSMPYLMSPVVRKLFARRTLAIDALPNAGESALAARSMLNAPSIEQKALFRGGISGFSFEEVLEGELDGLETVEIQVWLYDPLIAGLDSVDDVSLALSLAKEQDERINGELNDLFGEEGLWR